MKRTTARLIILSAAACFWMTGCASTSSINSPSRLWWDDLAFEDNADGIPPDWEIFDISQGSYDRYDNDLNDVGSDAFDIIK